jgi:hypothetical protein
MKTTVSTYLSLNAKDFIKGLLMAFIGVILTGLITSINAGSLPLDWAAWKPILMGGLSAALAYFAKNFLTNSSDQFLKKEDPATSPNNK